MATEPVAQRMIEALDRSRQLDVAVGWGPTVGYYARLAKVPLTSHRPPDDTSAPESFSNRDRACAIDEPALRDALNAALDREQPRIDALLAEYGVPLLPLRAYGRRSRNEAVRPGGRLMIVVLRAVDDCAACERESRDFPRPAPGAEVGDKETAAAMIAHYERNAYALADRQEALELVQLQRLPCQRRWRLRPRA